MWEITQILVGYAKPSADSSSINASGSVTLISNETSKILVDCGSPWNGNELAKALNSRSLRCSDITDVVITHGHIDHCGNLSMFPRATIYMDNDQAEPNALYTNFEDNHLIADGVKILRTPGHTDHDLSVIVLNSNEEITVVAGDIFEDDKADDWQRNSRYPSRQQESRFRILQVANWIIPGHGKIFKNIPHGINH
ncbi:unnamed protein product [Dracunculus medinensis]|uniref:Lactamase_B domain-containing protein n=1 Tax=Dracunculus medinensis TaxID=318479 RepID=A0A0N4UIK0_DRAME|nr:unnamed protein product [Dracunculus medinensis]